MIAAGMGQKAGRRRYGEPVGRIGHGADPEGGDLGRGGQGDVVPVRSGEELQPSLGAIEGAPTENRFDEDPGFVLAKGEAARSARPGVRRARQDPETFAFGRCGGRAGQTRGDHQLHRGIQHLQCLVVGDVLLRLSRFDIGQGKIDRDIRHDCILRCDRFDAPILHRFPVAGTNGGGAD